MRNLVPVCQIVQSYGICQIFPFSLLYSTLLLSLLPLPWPEPNKYGIQLMPFTLPLFSHSVYVSVYRVKPNTSLVFCYMNVFEICQISLPCDPCYKVCLVAYETCGYYLGHENVYGMIGALGAHMPQLQV
jgi:hypothetical protein